MASIRPCQAIDLFGERSSASGQVTTGCLPLSNHVFTAWNLCTQTQASPNLVMSLCGVDAPGAPKWLTSRYFNIVAKAPIPIGSPGRDVHYRTMLRNLLVDRFKMITHYEDRLVDVYMLVAAKPKLRKADPSSRTGCKSNGARPGIPTVVICRNVTMAQFAEELNHHMVIVASHRRVVNA
ncbi:MAG: TIGR03435 family protein, partial [Limisphaerales bacterium]